MGSRNAGTCYFYYSHAVLHKYGWETRSRAACGGKHLRGEFAKPRGIDKFRRKVASPKGLQTANDGHF